ncbi:MAG: sigma-70 family RNA polymerase sigma factor [Spirochaetaceae bacterium]|nr:MAG: sigma-70 family RNA polymerase sigma factor [Spirochaetaceae bacterium]
MEQRSNRDWLDALKKPGPERDRALADLRSLLVRGLNYALRGWRRTAGRDFEALAEDFCQEALLRILDNLDSFEGRSRFTTWAHKIAVRVALTEMRRKRWQDVSLDKLVAEQGVVSTMSSDEAGPEAEAERSDLMSWMKRIMMEELTEKQRTAISAVAFGGMPLEEVARRMETNRNALYKLVHDGRVRLKRRLSKEGMNPQDILASMG